MAAQWDDFVGQAVNGVFLFKRGFMDYHADRFEDHSLIIVDRDNADKWQAIAPGNMADQLWCSHAGLSYGGLIFGRDMSQTRLIDCLKLCMAYLRNQKFKQMELKLVPAIYYREKNHSLDYAVTYAGFELFRRDASTTIFLEQRRKTKKGRKACISKARREGVRARQVDSKEDYVAFMAMENANLQKKYGVNAVHSVEEIELLRNRFPDNIRLYIAKREGELLAGGLTFENDGVVHLQYFAATSQGEILSAGDVLIEAILDYCEANAFSVFDFGISTEQQGQYLNQGLNRYKESFGGVTTVADFYRATLS